MNWLGKIVSSHIDKNDIVLDLGCGIMQATTGFLDGGKSVKCKTILGVELIEKYLDVIKKTYPTIKNDVRNTHLFMDDSFDVVLCIDIIEHLEPEDAHYLIDEMKRIARKKVIIYTPSKWITNEENIDNAWGLGENQYQKHLSYITPKEYEKMGFVVSFPEPDKNTFAVWLKT